MDQSPDKKMRRAEEGHGWSENHARQQQMPRGLPVSMSHGGLAEATKRPVSHVVCLQWEPLQCATLFFCSKSSSGFPP